MDVCCIAIACNGVIDLCCRANCTVQVWDIDQPVVNPSVDVVQERNEVNSTSVMRRGRPTVRIHFAVNGSSGQPTKHSLDAAAGGGYSDRSTVQ